MLPQRLDLPFSLINRPTMHREGVSPELNEVFPGWILYGNYYMIVRNEDKFANRNKSKRNLFEMSIMRPDIIAMIVKARNSLAFVRFIDDERDGMCVRHDRRIAGGTVEGMRGRGGSRVFGAKRKKWREER